MTDHHAAPVPAEAAPLPPEYSIADLAGKIFPSAVFFGALSLLVGFLLALGSESGLKYFLHSYLVNYSFFLAIALGGLFFVAATTVCRAGWSIVLRRPAEIVANVVVMLAILFLPILVSVLFSTSPLYEWDDPALVQADHLLQHKTPFLNAKFFAIRAVIYFTIWILLARSYFARSVEQDATGDPQLTLANERQSPVALFLFALSLTFASFDWLMSLDPKWFSTIYGVYYFAGCASGIFATLILLCIFLQSQGVLVKEITVEHYHDLGKFLLGFTVFWAYIWFSQYMLIWYANMPEETEYFIHRQHGAWPWIAVVLVGGHFVVPFLGLLSRSVKRSKYALGFWATWILAMHWLDQYWMIMPRISLDTLPFGIVDVLCFVGIGGLCIAWFARTATGVSMLATRDPRLPESLVFKNF